MGGLNIPTQSSGQRSLAVAGPLGAGPQSGINQLGDAAKATSSLIDAGKDIASIFKKDKKAGGKVSLDGEIQGTRPTGGRLARAKGGRNDSTYGVSTPLRLVKSHAGSKGHTAKVYKDQEWGEYRVKHFDPEGQHLPDMDYHTDDRDEAHDQAKYAVDKGFNKGGRTARKAGGRAKGKTNINIVIATGKGGQDGMMPPGGGMPPKPAGMPIPVPPAGAGAPPLMGVPMPMPAGAGAPPPPPGGMPLARKRGGRTYRSYKDMDAGSNSGEGRLEKTEIQRHKR
jgi:hypothetical protein